MFRSAPRHSANNPNERPDHLVESRPGVTLDPVAVPHDASGFETCEHLARRPEGSHVSLSPMSSADTGTLRQIKRNRSRSPAQLSRQIRVLQPDHPSRRSRVPSHIQRHLIDSKHLNTPDTCPGPFRGTRPPRQRAEGAARLATLSERSDRPEPRGATRSRASGEDGEHGEDGLALRRPSTRLP